MKLKLRYLQRLGDVIGLLSTAHALTQRGHEAWIECYPRYADILKASSFVRYSNPYCPEPCEQTFNLAIHRDGGGSDARYFQFRESRKSWPQFVIESVPELAATSGPPVFDRLDWFDPSRYNLPANGEYALVVPGGYSQQQRHDPARVVALAKRLFPGQRLVILSDKPGPTALTLRRLRDMPGLCAHARHMLTINTSAAIVAAGVRDSFHFIPQTGAAEQDNGDYGKGIRVSP